MAFALGSRSMLTQLGCLTAASSSTTRLRLCHGCRRSLARTTLAITTSSPVRRFAAGPAFGSAQEQTVEHPVAIATSDDISPESSAPSVVLRPYQEAAITACLDALGESTTRMGVSSPTGSGKTTMFMRLIPHIVGTGKKRKKTLIIVNAIELASQSENAARRLLGQGWIVEMDQGKHQATGSADVTVATSQTLSREGRLDKYRPEDYGLIIVDEAHHAAAKSYLRILQYFNSGVSLPSKVEPFASLEHEHRVPIVGFSATFSRPDQLALSAAFERIVFHREISTMLQDGWLSPAKATSVHADLDLDSIPENRAGDFNTAELSSRMDRPEVNQLIVKTHRHIASDRRSTLIFCVDLAHVDSLTTTFQKAGIDARSVSSNSRPGYRKHTLEAFLKGEFPVLVNCEVLTEGTDIPVIDCVILARPTRSRNLLAQMIGRGLRLSPDTGKEDCYIIDVVDNMSRGLSVTPTLLGLTHDVLEEEQREREERLAKEAENAGETTNADSPEKAKGKYKVQFIDDSDPFGLETDRNKHKAVAQMTHLAWVAVGKGRYILDTMKGGDYIKIERSALDSAQSGKWAITLNIKAPAFFQSRPGTRLSRAVAHADDLERAFESADVYALKRVGREMHSSLERRAPWRQRPASEKQLRLLLKMKGVDSIEGISLPSQITIMGRTVPTRLITAGQVNSYLTATKRGGYTKRKNENDKVEKQEAREEARRVAVEEKRKMVDLPLPAEL